MNHKRISVTFAIVLFSIIPALGIISLDSDCNITKGCFYQCESTKKCSFLVSWVDSGMAVTYTLQTQLDGSFIWMAVGFSDDKRMGKDSITGCKKENDEISLYNAKSEGQFTPRKLGNEGVTLLNSSYVGDEFKCTFSRVKAPGDNTERFDLNQPWYLLFARGLLKQSLDIGYHGRGGRFFSEVKYDPSFQPKPAEVMKTVTTEPTEVTASAEATTTVTTQTPEDSDCNITKGCFYQCESTKKCSFLVSWVDSGMAVTYTLQTQLDGSFIWMAVGFSDDNRMGNDSITGCKKEDDNISLFNAKSEGRFTPKMLDNEGVTLLNSSYEGDEFRCTFSRVKAAGENTERFALNQPWYLLFARGLLKRSLEIGYHGQDGRFFSEVKYDPSFQPKPTEVTATATTTVTTQPPEVTTAVPTHTTEMTNDLSTQPTEMSKTTEVTTSMSSNHSVLNIEGCGKTVSCYSDCVGMVCTFIVSWSVIGNNVLYTLTSNVDRKSGVWIALGLSQDDLMGDDDVLGCVVNAADQVVAFTAWNARHNDPYMHIDPDIKLVAKKTEDNSLSCTLQRPIAALGSYRVNVNESWTLLFAKGPGEFSAAGKFHISYHGHDRHASANQLRASDLVDNGVKNVQHPLVKAHGSLMIGAWILFASVGIIVARYYKPVWKSKICSQSVWFLIHRICMVLVFCATTAGFIIIFIDVKGYSHIHENKTFLQGHPIIGIIVMVLTVLNPAMAVFRPHPGTQKRSVFNWAHRLVGISANILAVLNIFFGVMLTRTDVPCYLVYILAAYVAWQLFVGIVLESISQLGLKLDHREIYEICDKDPTQSGLAVEGTKIVLAKRIILVVHCFIVASIAAALIVLLVLGSEKLEYH